MPHNNESIPPNPNPRPGPGTDEKLPAVVLHEKRSYFSACIILSGCYRNDTETEGSILLLTKRILGAHVYSLVACCLVMCVCFLISMVFTALFLIAHLYKILIVWHSYLILFTYIARPPTSREIVILCHTMRQQRVKILLISYSLLQIFIMLTRRSRCSTKSSNRHQVS